MTNFSLCDLRSNELQVYRVRNRKVSAQGSFGIKSVSNEMIKEDCREYSEKKIAANNSYNLK